MTFVPDRDWPSLRTRCGAVVHAFADVEALKELVERATVDDASAFSAGTLWSSLPDLQTS